MLTNKFLMVVMVIGEGMGHRRIAGPYRRKRHSEGERVNVCSRVMDKMTTVTRIMDLH